jgi:hypothetical protein
MTCSFDQTAVIYRRSPLQRVGWINYPGTEGSVAWEINSITVGSPDSKGERIVAAGLMSGWCTSNYGDIDLEIWKLTGREMRPLLNRDFGARRDEPVAAAIGRRRSIHLPDKCRRQRDLYSISHREV